MQQEHNGPVMGIRLEDFYISMKLSIRSIVINTILHDIVITFLALFQCFTQHLALSGCSAYKCFG